MGYTEYDDMAKGGDIKREKLEKMILNTRWWLSTFNNSKIDAACMTTRQLSQVRGLPSLFFIPSFLNTTSSIRSLTRSPSLQFLSIKTRSALDQDFFVNSPFNQQWRWSG